MADISITAASVVPGTNATLKHGVAGEALTAGQPVYQDATTKKWLKADADSATAAARSALGMALCGSALNQPVTVLTDGDVTLGAVLTAGLAYYLSGTAGGICPVADVGSGEYVCLLGLAKSTSVLAFDPKFPNVAN